MMISGVKEISLKVFADQRGDFLKVLNLTEPAFKFDVREIYYSRSFRGIIRGFHFQEAPKDGFKIVHLISGSIHDVLLDTRLTSPTYGEFQAFDLKATDPKILVIPPGVAHGFQAYEDSLLMYITSNDYSSLHDKGFNPIKSYSSWPLDPEAISVRDLGLPVFLKVPIE